MRRNQAEAAGKVFMQLFYNGGIWKTEDDFFGIFFIGEIRGTSNDRFT